MRRALCGLILLMTGCTAPVPASVDGDDDGHDTIVALLDRAEIDAELAGSPVHEATAPFVRLSYLTRSAVEGHLEISTSLDGVSWSDPREGVLSSEASDADAGVWVRDLDLDAEARFWRVRGASEARELAVVTETRDELAADLESDEDETTTIASGDPNVGATAAALTNFRRYRYDLGYVGRSWLWLLRGARSRGWSGSLYGPRTGLRTYAQQASLWNAYQNGTGAPAFPPWGPSRHLIRNVRRVGTWYQAVDTSDVPGLIAAARRMGVSLHLPYASREAWHVEATHGFGPPSSWRP